MKHAILGTLAVLAAAGCMNERVYTDPTQNLTRAGGDLSNLVLQNGTIRGDFGPRTGIDGPATLLEGSSDPGLRSSTVTAAREDTTRGTGMIIIWTSGNTLERLEPGEHAFTYDASSVDTPEIAVNVCSGADDASIDYDRPADSGTLTVTEGPQGREIAVHTETLVTDFESNATGQVETSDTSFVIGRSAN